MLSYTPALAGGTPRLTYIFFTSIPPPSVRSTNPKYIGRLPNGVWYSKIGPGCFTLCKVFYISLAFYTAQPYCRLLPSLTFTFSEVPITTSILIRDSSLSQDKRRTHLPGPPLIDPGPREAKQLSFIQKHLPYSPFDSTGKARRCRLALCTWSDSIVPSQFRSSREHVVWVQLHTRIHTSLSVFCILGPCTSLAQGQYR